MSRTAVIRPRAQEDIDGIAEHIARNNPDAAARFLDAAEATIHLLASNPGIGSPCTFHNPAAAGLRRTTISGFQKYLIFFRPTPDGVEIVRVLYGARDLPALFESADE